jgi:hypothetical protein
VIEDILTWEACGVWAVEAFGVGTIQCSGQLIQFFIRQLTLLEAYSTSSRLAIAVATL